VLPHPLKYETNTHEFVRITRENWSCTGVGDDNSFSRRNWTGVKENRGSEDECGIGVASGSSGLLYFTCRINFSWFFF
jgi:hypothetical protein